jgi:hypothetical protein
MGKDAEAKMVLTGVGCAVVLAIVAYGGIAYILLHFVLKWW